MPSHWGFCKLLRTTNLLAKSSTAKALEFSKARGFRLRICWFGKGSPNKGPFEAGNWALASAQSNVGLEERPGTGQGEEGLCDRWRKYNISPYGEGFHFKTLKSVSEAIIFCLSASSADWENVDLTTLSVFEQKREMILSFPCSLCSLE